jgi:hypothetical protein
VTEEAKRAQKVKRVRTRQPERATTTARSEEAAAVVGTLDPRDVDPEDAPDEAKTTTRAGVPL